MGRLWLRAVLMLMRKLVDRLGLVMARYERVAAVTIAVVTVVTRVLLVRQEVGVGRRDMAGKLA